MIERYAKLPRLYHQRRRCPPLPQRVTQPAEDLLAAPAAQVGQVYCGRVEGPVVVQVAAQVAEAAVLAVGRVKMRLVIGQGVAVLV